MKFQSHYSGKKSKTFWEKINKIKGDDHDVAYLTGVMLQDIECYLLNRLKNMTP